MKLKILASIVFGTVTGVSSAASYTLGNGTGATASGIATSNGSTFRAPTPGTPGNTPTNVGDAFPSGGGNWAGAGVISYGIFSTEDFSSFTSTAQFISAFTPFGVSVTNPDPAFQFNQFGASGNRSVYTMALVANVTGTSFAGKNMFVFAGNGTTFADSTELLVLKSNNLFVASDDSISTPISIVVRPTAANPANPLQTGSTVLFGSLIPNVQTTNTDASTTQGFQMAVVIPEPSAALLGALGALGLLRRRRN